MNGDRRKKCSRLNLGVVLVKEEAKWLGSSFFLHKLCSETIEQKVLHAHQEEPAKKNNLLILFVFLYSVL